MTEPDWRTEPLTTEMLATLRDQMAAAADAKKPHTALQPHTAVRLIDEIQRLRKVDQ